MKLTHRLFASHLDDGERIIDTAHRHFFIFLRDSKKVWLIGVALPTVLLYFLPKVLIIALCWWGVALFGLAYHFLDWFSDAWLITNVGVIDIERHGLFSRNSTRVDYHMIEGISYNIDGFMPTVLGYGDITLDKLGVQTSLVLKDAAHPKLIERKILKFQERFVRDRSIRDHNVLKDMLSEMIAYHVQNNKINASNNE